MKKPPVLFFAFANYHDEGYLRNIPLEEEGIEESLLIAQREGLCEIVTLSYATIEKVMNVFQDVRYRDRIALFHFAGHSDSYTLKLETPYRQQASLYIDGFAGLLSLQRNLQLVFLNGCVTRIQAKNLPRVGIPVVIRTISEVDDTVARRIAIQFYKSFAIGNSIYRSFEEARLTFHSKGQTRNIRGLYREDITISEPEEVPWGIRTHPEKLEAAQWNLLDANDRPLYLLPILRTDNLLPSNLLPSNPFPGSNTYTLDQAMIFGGRDSEIRKLSDQLKDMNSTRVLLLYGAGGVGKSSLLNAGLLPRISSSFLMLNKKEEPKEINKQLTQFFRSSEQRRNRNTNTYVILDNLTIADFDLSKRIKEAPQHIKFLISTRTIHRSQWEIALGQSKLGFIVFHLPPLTYTGILHWITQIKNSYDLEVDKSLPYIIAKDLTIDLKSPIAPTLQTIFEQMWVNAKKLNYSNPKLTITLYKKIQAPIFWKNFLLNRLNVIDQQAASSGLLLSVLKKISLASSYPHSKNIFEILQKEYAHIENYYELLLQKLQDHYLISEPANDNFQSTKTLRLSHQLLQIPLFDLTIESNRPAQEIERLFLHHLKYDSYHKFSPSQIRFIEKHTSKTPALDKERCKLLRTSKQTIQRKKIHKWILDGFRIVITSLLICWSFQFNPYLLIYLILLLALYDNRTQSYYIKS